jgi:hypothetical protein
VNYFKKKDFENAVKFGDDEEIGDTAKELYDDAIGRLSQTETAEFISKTLLEKKKYETREICGTVEYDGIKVRTKPYPDLIIEDDDC